MGRRRAGQLDAVVPLAALLEKQDKLDDAKKLLLPFKDKLGDGEGARVLGQILGRQGDYDGAYALLWPYVKSRLDRLHAAEKAAEDAIEQIQHREIGRLKDNQARVTSTPGTTAAARPNRRRSCVNTSTPRSRTTRNSRRHRKTSNTRPRLFPSRWNWASS